MTGLHLFLGSRSQWLLLLLLHCSLLASVSAQNVSDCTVFAVSSECSEGDDACRSLQETLDQLAGLEKSVLRPGDCLEVELEAGRHVISQAVTIEGINVSLAIRGEGNASSIECAPTVTLDLNHVIFLDGLNSFAFEGLAVYNCVRPIRVSNSRRVSFWLSSFRYFTSGVVDVFNCVDVSFVNVTLVENQALTPITDTPFRANAGGISIGVKNLPFTNSTPVISVLNCTFMFNRADPPSNDVVSTSQLFIRSIFVGRGGGLGVFVRESARVTTIVRDCRFEGNYATTFGGGMYVIMDGSVSNHSVYVSNSWFIDNSCDGGGGGLHTGYFNPTTALHSVTVTNCTFIGNRALLGGGSYVFPGVGVGRVYSVRYEDCVFRNNTADEYGAALGLYSLDLFRDDEAINAYVIDTCIFENNFGTRAGTLSVSYSPILMLGHSSFINNTGPSLRLLGTTLTVNSRLEFIGNSAENSDGGALYVTSYGQVVLEKGADMTFIRNRGNLGSAIVVQAQQVSEGGFVELAYNPLCFLRYGPDQMISPLNWTGVSMSFSENTAIVGPAVYTNHISLCSWYQLSPPYFDTSLVLRWPFVNLTDNNFNSGHADELRSNSSLYIQTPAVSLELNTPNISGYPGEPLNLQVTTLDELDNPTYSIVRLNDLTIPERSKSFTFTPSLLDFEPNANRRYISFAVSTDQFVVSAYNVKLSIYDSFSPETNSLIEDALFSAQLCLPGYTLEEDSTGRFLTCQCNTANNEFLVECEGNRLILSPHIWSTVENNNNRSLSLRSYRCPLDYCQAIHDTSFGSRTYATLFNYTDTDIQCSCNRSGVLCGQCPDGYGVSALFNHCVSCSNAYSMLIIILVLAVMLVCVFVVTLSKPLPVWVYPCLFYVQILPLVTDGFPITFQKVQSGLYYFSSALSLYFPYDFCLYETMSPLVSYTFRYLPLLTAAVGVVVVLPIRRMKLRPAPWHGVWVLIFLMYPHIVNTSISILNCPDIHPHGHRWYIDGSITCFSGAHAALGVVAILILLLTALLIPLTILTSLNVIRKARWQRSVRSPIVHAFRENLHWCVGVELGRRLIVLLFAAAFPGDPVVTAFILILFTGFYLFVQPYKSKLANIIEAVLAVDSLILFFLAANTAASEGLTLEQSMQLSSVRFEEHKCPYPVVGVTALTLLMSPFYYLPLIVLLVGVGVDAAYFIRQRWKNRTMKTTDEYIPYNAQYELGDVSIAETRTAVDFRHTSVGF